MLKFYLLAQVSTSQKSNCFKDRGTQHYSYKNSAIIFTEIITSSTIAFTL